MVYTGFIPAEQVLGRAPFSAGTPPLHQEIARGIGRSLPGAIRTTPRPFVASPALFAASVALYLEPYAQEIWQNFLNEQIPVTIEIPAPLIAPNSMIYWSAKTSWKNKDTGATFIDSLSGEVGFYNSIVRGVFPVTAVNERMTWAFRARNTAGVVDTIQISNLYDPTFWERIGVVEWLVRSTPQADPLPSPGAPTVVPETPAPFSPNVPLIIPVNPVPGLVPSPVRYPVIIPSPSQIPNHPIPLIPQPASDPEQETPRFPPIWLAPGGIQIGTPPQSPVLYPPTVGIPETQTQPEIQRERGRVGLPCLPCPDEGGCDCDEIREVIKEELDEKFPPKRPNVIRTLAPSIGNSGVFNLPVNTVKVTLELTEIPTTARTQFGMNAPDVIYAGWSSFDTGERMPVHYENNTYYPPNRDAQKWSYTLYAGFVGRVRIYFIEEL